MDMTRSVQPRSDQINADDLIATGPVDVTITGVHEGKAEQPFDFDLAEFPGRAFRPGVTMRRVIIHAWGGETDAYVGRRLRLFCDPSVRFGKEVVGGVRISHMSDISKTMTIPVTVTRGHRQPYTVEPLPDAAPAPAARPVPTLDEINAATDEDTLRAMWSAGGDQQAITRRVAELRATVTPLPAPDEGGDAA